MGPRELLAPGSRTKAWKIFRDLSALCGVIAALGFIGTQYQRTGDVEDVQGQVAAVLVRVDELFAQSCAVGNERLVGNEEATQAGLIAVAELAIEEGDLDVDLDDPEVRESFLAKANEQLDVIWDEQPELSPRDCRTASIDPIAPTPTTEGP